MRPVTLRWLIASVFLVLMLVACSDSGGDAEATTEASTTRATTTVAPATTTIAPATTDSGAFVAVEGSYEVSSTMVSHATTRDILVWTPVGEGPWPVVYAIPGSEGGALQDFDVLGPELASHGILVFATDWRTTNSVEVFVTDLECGYRFSRTVAPEYGGDLTQPVTMVGFSMGASGALYQAVDEGEFGPEGYWVPYYGPASSQPDKCFAEEAARPDVVVGIAGCYLGAGFPSGVGDIQEMGNRDADYILVHSRDDAVCSTGESDHAEGSLERKDYDVTMVEIAGAGHGDFVFHDLDNDWATLPVDHPAGQQTVATILAAIEKAQQ